MAKGKYHKWLQPANLEQITNWVANGNTDEQVADLMRVAPSTFYEWRNRFAEISEAVEKGRELQPDVMENVFYSRARGGITVTEVIEEFRGDLVEGKPYNGKIVRRTVRKELPPDPGSLMFIMKNKKGYRSEPVAEVKVDVAPTFVYERADG